MTVAIVLFVAFSFLAIFRNRQVTKSNYFVRYKRWGTTLSKGFHDLDKASMFAEKRGESFQGLYRVNH